MSDALQLLCDLSEASDQAFRDNAVEPQWRDSLNVLVGLGAIEPGPPPHTIACSDCDDDHPAVIEYDAERRRFRHFCGEADSFGSMMPGSGHIGSDRNGR